jgi:hypothetical protein
LRSDQLPDPGRDLPTPHRWMTLNFARRMQQKFLGGASFRPRSRRHISFTAIS